MPPKIIREPKTPEQRIIWLHKCLEFLKARQRHNESLLQFIKDANPEQKDNYLKDELKLDYSGARADRAWPIVRSTLEKDIGNEQSFLLAFAEDLEEILLEEQPDCLSIAVVLQVYLAMAKRIKDTTPAIAAKRRRDILGDKRQNKISEEEYYATADIINIGIEAYYSLDSIRILNFFDNILRTRVYDPIELDLVDKYVEVIVLEDSDEILANISSNFNFEELQKANIACIKTAVAKMQKRREAVLTKFQRPDFAPDVREVPKFISPKKIKKLQLGTAADQKERTTMMQSYRYEYYLATNVASVVDEYETYLRTEEDWLQQQADFLKSTAERAEEFRKKEIATRKQSHELALLKQKEANEVAKVKAEEDKRRAHLQRVQTQLNSAPIVTKRIQKPERISLVSMDRIDANIEDLRILFSPETSEYTFTKACTLLTALGFVLGAEGGGSHREIKFKDYLIQELKTVGGFAEKKVLRGFNLYLFCVGISSLFPDGWQARLEQDSQAKIHAKWAPHRGV